MEGIYCLADKTIVINTIRSDIHTLCAKYRSDGVADFSVEITQKDIDFERECSIA